MLRWLAAPASLMGVAIFLPWARGSHSGGALDAAAIGLWVAMVLVLLLNAVHGDGCAPETSAFFRVWRVVLVVALVLASVASIVGLAADYRRHDVHPFLLYAVGWWLVMACYALGYSVAAVTSGPDLLRLPGVNIAAAAIGVVVAIALLTSIADPFRLTISHRVAALEAGITPLGAFDFDYLRRSGRYGQAELQRLAAKQDGPDAAEIARRARQTLAK